MISLVDSRFILYSFTTLKMLCEIPWLLVEIWLGGCTIGFVIWQRLDLLGREWPEGLFYQSKARPKDSM